MAAPLADRIRPQSLDEMVGQQHLLGPNGLLRRIAQSGTLPNLIFYGPSGVGKPPRPASLRRARAKSSIVLMALRPPPGISKPSLRI